MHKCKCKTHRNNTSIQVDEEGNLETEMLLSVIPEQFQEIGNKILNKCAVQGKLRVNFFTWICYIVDLCFTNKFLDGADACEKIYNVAKCVQGTVPEVSRHYFFKSII